MSLTIEDVELHVGDVLYVSWPASRHGRAETIVRRCEVIGFALGTVEVRTLDPLEDE